MRKALPEHCHLEKVGVEDIMAALHENAGPAGKDSFDFNLLTTRLKEMALKGQNQEKCLQTLGKRKLWAWLSPAQLRQWSEAALILGKADLALEMLAWLNSSQPQDQQAWQERHELLCRLNRLQQAESVRAAAIEHHPELKLKLMPQQPQSEPKENQDQDLDDPFVRQKQRQRLLDLYLELFQGREDVFARQWVNQEKGTQGYMPVRRPLQAEDVLEHIKGHKTYGIYLLRRDSSVKTGVMDLDLKKDFRSGSIKPRDKSGIRQERDYVLRRLQELSKERLNASALVEFSGGKGYHLWFLLQEPAPAEQVRQCLSRIAAVVADDLSYFNLEVFPKQDRLQGKGLGNLVKLPLGVHRRSGKPSYFLGKSRSDPWNNCQELEKAELIGPEDLRSCSSQAKPDKTVLHPRQRQWVEKYPELKLLSERCPALGRIITALRMHKELGTREERILLQTLGFLSRGRLLVHDLCQNLPEYNQHLVDYKLSRLGGSPMGCKKIHQLLQLSIDYCSFEGSYAYAHPLLHCPEYMPAEQEGQKTVESLQDALEQLRLSLDMVSRFLPDKQG